MKIKKGVSWLIGIIVLTGLYILTLFTAPDVLGNIGGTIVLALAFATVGYQGVQVVDNYQKAVHYRPEMDDK